MKNFLTKKNILISSSIYVLFFVVLFFQNIICDSSFCRIHDTDVLGRIFFVLMPLLPVFLFSITTYKMPEKVFRHWINFAQWATPLLMIMTFLILGGGNNGMGVEGVIGGAFDAFLIGFFYVLFVGISIWRIVSVRKK